jgi:hypothetical protein
MGISSGAGDMAEEKSRSLSESFNVPLETYQKVLRKEVEERLWGRIKVIGAFLGLAGIAGYVSLLQIFIDPLTTKVNNEITELKTQAVQQVTASVESNLEARIATQVARIVAETLKRELATESSTISQAVLQEATRVIAERFSDPEFRDRIDLSVLRAQVLSPMLEPPRRSFAFGQLLYLKEGPQAAHGALMQLLGRRLEGEDIRAVDLMVNQFAADQRPTVQIDRNLARLAIDRAAEGFPLDGVLGLLMRLPAQEAATLLRTASYANSPTMQVALELLRKDNRYEALEALAEIASNASPGRVGQLIQHIGRRAAVPADEAGLHRGPQVWNSMLREVLPTRGIGTMLGAVDLDNDALLDLRVVSLPISRQLQTTSRRSLQRLQQRPAAQVGPALPPEVVAVLTELATVTASTPRSATERRSTDQARRALVFPFFGLEAADDAQLEGRVAMARLLPVADGADPPPWWNAATGLVRSPPGAGSLRERLLALTLLTDRVIRLEADTQATGGMRLELLRIIGADADLRAQPIAIRAATSLLSNAESGPICLDGLRELTAAIPDDPVPLLLAAAACRERSSVADIIALLGNVFRGAGKVPATGRDRLGLALLVALVRDFPPTSAPTEELTVWDAIATTIPALPRESEAGREAFALV